MAEKKAVKTAPVKKKAQIRPKVVSSATIQANLKKVQSDVDILIRKKQLAKKPFKHLMVLKNRLRVMLNQYDRFMRNIKE